MLNNNKNCFCRAHSKLVTRVPQVLDQFSFTQRTPRWNQVVCSKRLAKQTRVPKMLLLWLNANMLAMLTLTSMAKRRHKDQRVVPRNNSNINRHHRCSWLLARPSTQVICTVVSSNRSRCSHRSRNSSAVPNWQVHYRLRTPRASTMTSMVHVPW